MQYLAVSGSKLIFNKFIDSVLYNFKNLSPAAVMVIKGNDVRQILKKMAKDSNKDEIQLKIHKDLISSVFNLIN